MRLHHAAGRRQRALGTLIVACVFLFSPNAQASSGPGADFDLPNLAARPSDYVESALSRTPVGPLELYLEDGHDPRVLRFTTRAANAGVFPLDILGVPTANAAALQASQCVRWAEPACQKRVQVGVMEWHQAHQHWHFNDFALYELRRLLSDGAPDMSPAGLVGSGTKASFCLMDSERDQPGGSLVGPYRTCSGLVQGISASWTDVYDASLPGQELSLAGAEDGVYALVLTLDPDNRLHESDETDNQAWSFVEVSEHGSHARLVDQP